MVTPGDGRNGSKDTCADTCAVAAGCDFGFGALCVRIALLHGEKADLCDQLEAVADSLPNCVDRWTCLDVAERLEALFRLAHRFEEDVLFPAFVEGGQRAARLATIDRLKLEHVHDESAAAEIAEELQRIGNGGAISNPEALGFMLRAFFDTVRRHMAFEREHMFPPEWMQPVR